MANITTTLGLAANGDDLPSTRTYIWTNAADEPCAAVYFQVGEGEFGFNASAEQIDQLLRDALNALGEAVDAHEQEHTAKTEAVSA